MNKVSFLFILTLVTGDLLQAQSRISVDDFTTRATFAEKKVTGINWMSDGKYYTALADNKIVRYDITSGRAVETLVDGNELSTQLKIEDYSFSADESQILLQTDVRRIYRRSFVAEYYVYDRTLRRLQQLSPGGPLSYAAFSPDGSKIAFVRENNLFYVTVSVMTEVQVTLDGKFGEIINGTTDWVYEEEFSFVVGFAWSPDNRKLAYYRFDESAVAEYNLQYWAGLLYPYDYRYKYPKAGERNSLVEIWMYDLASERRMKVDLGTETDIYVPRIRWTSDPNTLSVIRLNRLQNHLEVLHVDAASGKGSAVIDQKTDTYFDLEVLDILYLENGREFIFMSDEEGYMQLYLYSISGKVLRKLTEGSYDVTEFVGADEKNKRVYYMSAEGSPLERHLYTVTLDGKQKAKLTSVEGVHNINMSPDYQFYIDHYSSANLPTIATLYRTKRNAAMKVLESNEQLDARISEFDLAEKEFFTFPTEQGVELNGFFLKPKDFDPTKKYPVMVYQYSGPGSQAVAKSWGGSHFLFHQLLVQNGYIVVYIDPRGTTARGTAFKKATYMQLGKYELEDHLAGAKYLASLDFVDAARIGIWGWSYGGYMTSLVLTKGAGTFKLGIAVAPVTNWRFYDTIYTERYLQTPQLNPEGYDLNSPLTYANQLQGKFLLIHGTGDDNVHVQNSMAFQAALIAAGKQFESFYYPDRHHGIQGATTRHHLYTMMLRFVKENL